MITNRISITSSGVYIKEIDTDIDSDMEDIEELISQGDTIILSDEVDLDYLQEHVGLLLNFDSFTRVD